MSRAAHAVLAVFSIFNPPTLFAQKPMADQEMAITEMTQPTTLTTAILRHSSSGTSIEPPSTPMPMLMLRRDGWSLMLHGTAFVSDTQQSAGSGHGADKLFSTNWIMPMAQRRVGPGQLTLRTMLSLEPATITGRYYPELFQQGETAYGQAIVDGQHPHDFVMELGALYDVKLTERTLLSFYAAPVGDPAIGPTAYPHRASAGEDPIAALGHHQQDSTHIAFNVVTAGLTHGAFRVEGSGFHGAEPTEARWHFQPSPNGLAIDSYSTRLTFVPGANWAAQYSIAHITSPEALALTTDQRRQTASLMYTRALGTRGMPGMSMPATGSWSNTLLWGQTESLPGKLVENSFLFESLLTVHRNSYFTRVESAARTSELLDLARPEVGVGHVQAYTLGFDRGYQVAPHVLSAVGGQFTQYRAPDALAASYGRAPFAGSVFVHLRLN